MTAKPDAFLSYTRFDDRYDKISEFRTWLSDAVEEVSGNAFDIFQDVEGIGLGEKWRDVLDDMLDQARFFIPILTPKFFNSDACRDELTKFLELERKAGRQDLVLPVYWIDCSVLETNELKAKDELAQAIDERQRWDWRELRREDFLSREVQRELSRLALQIERARQRAIQTVEVSDAAVANDSPNLDNQTEGEVARNITFNQLLDEGATLAKISLESDLDESEAFRALYDCWVKAGGYVRGKPRRSVRRLKTWLDSSNRKVRSLETKLAGKNQLERADIGRLLSLFLERWHYDSDKDNDYPYSHRDRGALVEVLVTEIIDKAGGPLKLPPRSKKGNSSVRPTKQKGRAASSSENDGELVQEALPRLYGDSDALIVVSRRSTFVTDDSGGVMSRFHRLMDNLRQVDEADNRIRVIVWVVDLGQREEDAIAQAALQNLEFVATQFRSLLLTRHPDQYERHKWLRRRAIILVGALDFDEIDTLYASMDFQLKSPKGSDEKKGWIRADRLLFEGVPVPWISVFAERGIHTMAEQAITVHCKHDLRKEIGSNADVGDDIDFFLHYPGKDHNGNLAARCVGLPGLDARWKDAFRMAHDVALLRLGREQQHLNLPITPQECLALLRQQHFAALDVEEFLQFTTRLALKI